jgi:hypothetical protein
LKGTARGTVNSLEEDISKKKSLEEEKYLQHWLAVEGRGPTFQINSKAAIAKPSGSGL